MATPSKRASLVTATLAVGLTLSACGSGGSDHAASSSASAKPTPTATIAVQAMPVVEPSTDAAVLDGDMDNLTKYTNTHSAGVGIDPVYSGAARGFQRLCVGSSDVVASSRSMTPTEYAQCKADGLQPVQIQVGADAVVLAIKAQTDVGADCLSTDQLQAALEQGSSVNNWSDLGGGLNDVPFKAGGLSPASDQAGFFGAYILGDPDDGVATFRSDYHVTLPTQSEDITRNWVSGSTRDQKVALQYANVFRHYAQLHNLLKTYWGVWGGKNLAVQKAVASQKKGERTNRPAHQKHLDDLAVAHAYAERDVWITKVHTVRAHYRPVLARYLKVRAAYQRVRATFGRVGVFSDGYYNTYENELRPFEIQISDGSSHPNCIFPSPTTILNGQYPLSRQLLLTTTTRALARGDVRDYITNYLKNVTANAPRSGVVAVPDTTLNTELAWLDDPTTIPAFAPDSSGNLVAQSTPSATSTKTPSAPVTENPSR